MTEPHYADDAVTLYHGDCLDVLAELPDASVDAVVTDPPYGLEFMGKDWDRPWAVSPTQSVGFVGRENNLTLPSFGDSRNANCRACGGRQRGKRRCNCAKPNWDRDPAADMREFGQWCELWAAECLRVLKPGGHLLAFGGTRTWHRLACAIEDAGFEIRDNIAWLYGSGFPKSLNVATAVDKYRADENRADENRAELLPGEARFCEWMREHSGLTVLDAKRILGSARFITGVVEIVNTATADAPRMGRRAMVPTAAAWEKVRQMLATTPPEWVEQLVKAPPTEQTLADWNPGKGNGTVGDNKWAGWGTALKPAFEPVVVGRKPLTGTVAGNVLAHGVGALNIDACRVGTDERVNQPGSTKPRNSMGDSWREDAQPTACTGRWPSNVVVDECAAAEIDRQSGVSKSSPIGFKGSQRSVWDAAGRSGALESQTGAGDYGDEGGASRFFPTFRYQAKAATDERPTANGIAHPTVKPLDLMRWLVRLVTPPGGIVLEPFAGSGTTAEACIHEHLRCIAIEREADYLPLIVARLTKPMEIGFNFEANA